MKKIAVVFWSGTGNTEAMASAVANGAKKSGAEVKLARIGEITADELSGFDAVLFGCPAMGAEVLEESEFEPFFAEVEPKLSGTPVGLFGSYGWGGGEWMRQWEERVKGDGAVLIDAGLAVENSPDDAALASCEALGQKAAQ